MVLSGTVETRRFPASARHGVARAVRWPPLPVVLLVCGLLLPTFISIDIFGLRLPPYRLLFLALLPFALVRLISRRDIRIQNFDVAIFVFALWQGMAYTISSGAQGLTYGGSLAVEILGGYLIGRVYVRDLETLVATVRLILLSIMVAMSVALIDLIAGRPVLWELFHPLIGGDPPTEPDTRWGLRRGNATFDHPIHYGVYCATLFALIVRAEAELFKRFLTGAVVALATFLALSSAPLLSIALQSAMLFWEFVTRRIAHRVGITLAILAGLYIGVSLIATRSPIMLLISGATFDPWTGVYRTMIWEHGLNNVWAHPLTGLGLADWVRPDWMVASTIDAYWLVLTMRSGIPALLIVALALVLLLRKVARRGTASTDKKRRRLATGWMISILSLCVLGCTVHYWNGLHALMFFYIGLGGVFADPRRVPTRSGGRMAPRRNLKMAPPRPWQPAPNGALQPV